MITVCTHPGPVDAARGFPKWLYLLPLLEARDGISGCLTFVLLFGTLSF